MLSATETVTVSAPAPDLSQPPRRTDKRLKRDTTPTALVTKLKVKNLYLYQDASHKEIAKRTGLTESAVGNLIHRERWSQLKKEAARQLEDTHDARAQEAQQSIVEAIGSQAEEITLSGLERAREAVKRKGKDAARDFQSWTGGVRNLVQSIKAIRPGGAAIGGDGSVTNFNLFFAPVSPQAQSEPKQAEAVKPADQVTDV